MSYLHKNWPKMGMAAAFFIALLLFFYPGSTPWGFQWLFWLHVPVYMVHQFEEYVFPGGFKESLNQILGSASSDFPATDERVFWINVPLVWVALPVAAIVGLRFIILPASLMVVSLVNGLLHVGMGIRQRAYHPGILASAFLNIPLGGYTLYRLAQTGTMAPIQLAIAAGLGVFAHALLPLYFIRLTHKGRPIVS